MSEQIDPGQVEEQEASASGLLLSVEPLQGGGQLHATQGDRVDTDTDMTDTSDAASDADGTDAADTDATDGARGDTDGEDTLGGDSDGSDVSIDSDGSDSR